MRAGISKGEYKFIEGLIINHKRYPEWINDREQEILYPFQATDSNIGGGSSGIISNETERIASKLVHDKRLSELNRQYDAVSTVMSNTTQATRDIILEYYMQRPKTVTWQRLSEQVYLSPRHCKRLRDSFVVAVARELGLKSDTE